MIHCVDAPDDPRIAPYGRVGNHAWLTSAGLFVAEGRLILGRLIESQAYPIHSVLVTPAALDALREPLERLTSTVYVAEQAVLNGVTGFNFHRGCLALARRPDPAPLAAFFHARRLLGLEGVGNPDNIGGIFRVAAALGADGILLDAGSGDPFYRKALRTSMGAVLRVPFARIVEWPGAIAELRARGFKVFALTPDPSASAIVEIAAALPRDAGVALLLGAEGAGLTADAMAVADARVRIPIEPHVDSLNVVVAAGIALYALPRWRG